MKFNNISLYVCLISVATGFVACNETDERVGDLLPEYQEATLNSGQIQVQLNNPHNLDYSSDLDGISVYIGSTNKFFPFTRGEEGMMFVGQYPSDVRDSEKVIAFSGSNFTSGNELEVMTLGVPAIQEGVVSGSVKHIDDYTFWWGHQDDVTAIDQLSLQLQQFYPLLEFKLVNQTDSPLTVTDLELVLDPENESLPFLASAIIDFTGPTPAICTELTQQAKVSLALTEGTVVPVGEELTAYALIMPSAGLSDASALGPQVLVRYQVDDKTLGCPVNITDEAFLATITNGVETSSILSCPINLTQAALDEGSRDPDLNLVEGVYEIETLTGLTRFADIAQADPTVQGKLLADMNLANICNAEVGSWAAIENFEGTFDGNGFVIENLYIDEDKPAQGFFGILTGATILNMKLVNPKVQGTNNVGAIAGKALNGTMIKNCTISNGAVVGKGLLNPDTGKYIDSNTGGLLGVANDLVTIINCQYEGTVTASNSYTLIGGLVGKTTNEIDTPLISQCSVSGTISSEAKFVTMGGLVGTNNATISMCSVDGVVNTQNDGNIGGFIGKNNGLVVASYNTATVGTSNRVLAAGGIAGQNTGQIKSCYSTGQVLSISKSKRGSFVGKNLGLVHYCASLNTVSNESVNGCGSKDFGGTPDYAGNQIDIALSAIYAVVTADTSVQIEVDGVMKSLTDIWVDQGESAPTLNR